MSNHELPQTESNLQALENEVALTKQELEDFKKLPKKEQKRQKKEKLAKLEDLQIKLGQAIRESIQSGDIQAAQKLKEQLEREVADLEEIIDTGSTKFNTRFGPLLEKQFPTSTKKTVFKPITINPKDENYEAREANDNQGNSGEVTINPETQDLNWEKLKDGIFIPDLSSLIGKPLIVVAKYIVEKYSDEYNLPGIEYWKFMIENPDKVPEELKNGNWYFNFGSLICLPDGRWGVPRAYWVNGNWQYNVYQLYNREWRNYHSVTLFKKEKS